MFKSMTGFAQRDFDREGLSGGIQIKSYNNRYLDVSVSLPPQASALEPRILAMIGERLNRGKVEFSLRLKKVECPRSISPDLELAGSVYEAMSRIASRCGIDEKPSLRLISSFEGVLVYEKDMDSEGIWAPLAEEIGLALDEMESSREREGRATEENILAELARFEASLVLVRDNAADMDKTIRNQLQARFEELLPKGYDEQRLLQEVAVQLVRLTIAEEVARLDAHIGAFKAMSAEESPAKKLDFLCQEMNREVNTIGSKNSLVAVAHAVVEMKDALENIREQLRNIE